MAQVTEDFVDHDFEVDESFDELEDDYNVFMFDSYMSVDQKVRQQMSQDEYVDEVAA
jgi:division protein CdvB (Snf7/Vps24/ESCRT-III family)